MIVPTFFLGNASGHDFEFHLNSWMEVLRQWKLGIVYPRWAPLAHYGYGEARFIFYPPISWILGAALGALLPWVAVPDALIWLTLTLAGCSMFLLARTWLRRRDAVFAAALYAANPYHLVIIYWRSAFAELLVGALLPLLLLFILRLDREPRRAVIPLSVIIAVCWLTNAPAAVMVSYSLALLVVVIAFIRRSPRVLLWGAIAALVGLALASFYILPAAYEQKWVNISEVLSPGVRPQDNFLFTNTADAEHNRFNLLISMMAVAELAVITAGAGFWYAQRKSRAIDGAVQSNEMRLAEFALPIWIVACVLLMFSFTSVAWERLPQLRFVQFPWRWLLCCDVGFALVVTLVWRRWLSRVVVYAALLVVLAVAWQRVQQPWWDTTADINELADNIDSGQGHEGVYEYVPAGADPEEISRTAPLVAYQGQGTANISVLRWDPQVKAFDVEVTRPGQLVLRLFNYPAWKAKVNGRMVATSTNDVTGQMQIPVQAGDNAVNVRFTRTRDRTVGWIVSFLAALAITTLSASKKPRTLRNP